MPDIPHSEAAERLIVTARLLGRTPADVLRHSVAVGSITASDARVIARLAGIHGW